MIYGRSWTLDALRARLLPDPVLPLSPQRSDFDLNPGLRPSGGAPLTPAAVLIPVIARPAPTVLFTERSAGLKHHAGQVSFPGGKADPEDGSFTETALRELKEEVGIEAAYVRVAGFLEPYETVTRFAVQPVVGLLAEGFSLVPDAREVSSVFEVPLAFLLDPANCAVESRLVGSQKRFFYAFHTQGHTIWGATAAMLKILAERLR